MSNQLGYYGKEFYGTGYFGAVMAYSSLPLFVAIDWEKIFTQSIPTEMVISLKVYKNGATISLVDTDRIAIMASENRIGITAEMGASLGSAYVIGDQVQITLEITPGLGTPFEISLFNGFVSTLATGLNSVDNEEPVIVYLTSSQNRLLDEIPAITTWSGTASDLLSYALTQVGCQSVDIDIDDYSINQDFTFLTWRDLIKEIASGLTQASVIVTESGVGYARAWDRTDTIFSSDPLGFLIPRSGWVEQTKQDSQADQYRKVTIQGVSGVVGTAIDPAGIGTDYSETSNFLTTAAQCAQKAQSILDLSKRTIRTIVTPINPLLTVGALIRTTTAAGTVSGKILSITHSGSWQSGGGFWTTLTMGVDA